MWLPAQPPSALEGLEGPSSPGCYLLSLLPERNIVSCRSHGRLTPQEAVARGGSDCSACCLVVGKQIGNCIFGCPRGLQKVLEQGVPGSTPKCWSSWLLQAPCQHASLWFALVPWIVLSYSQGAEVKPHSKPFTQLHALYFPGHLLTFQAVF